MSTGIIATFESGVDVVFEWKINDFVTLSERDGAQYYSPEFFFGGEIWYLAIIPNGWSKQDSFGQVDLWLCECLSDRNIKQSFSLSLKTANGEKCNEQHFTKDFHNFNCIHEFNQVVPRSGLTRRKSELMPEGVLTVVCTMKNTTSAGSATGKDLKQKSEDAHVKASTERVEASTQTMEGKCEACASGSTTNFQEKKALHDFKELFLKKEECDVTIKVKSSKFPAHRVILKARSPVLASTFRHDMKESATGVLEIDDCNPSSFSDFLCYLYCADGQMITQKNVFDLFTLADKYQVLDLRSKCLEFMKNNLTVDTFCEIITLALRHSETELIKLCTDYFTIDAPKIIVTVKWQTFLAENPIESNELFIKILVPNTN